MTVTHPDMGEPMKIIDLARDLIRLSGLEEGVDVDITFSGVRPGEKLYEEVFFGHEAVEPTAHPKMLRSLVPDFHVPPPPPAVDDAEHRVSGGQRRLRLA